MDLEKQLAFYQRRYELNPHSRAFAPLADLYRRSGRLTEALELLEQGLAEHPRYVSGLVILGRCRLAAGDRDGAVAAFQRVLEIDPNNLVVLKLLAEDASRREDWTAASGLLERVVLLDPLDEPAEIELAGVRSRQQDAAEVRRPAPEAVDRPSAAAASYQEKATASETPDRTGRTQPPPRPASPAMGAPPEAPLPGAEEEPVRRSLATRTLAEIYLAQGYRGKALAVLREILDRHPEREDIRERLEELAAEGVSGPQAAGGEEGAPGDQDKGTKAGPVLARRTFPADAPERGPEQKHEQDQPQEQHPDEDQPRPGREQFKTWLHSISRREGDHN
jgi:tetratricopeptide (TPR) repeat protein